MMYVRWIYFSVIIDVLFILAFLKLLYYVDVVFMFQQGIVTFGVLSKVRVYVSKIKFYLKLLIIIVWDTMAFGFGHWDFVKLFIF